MSEHLSGYKEGAQNVDDLSNGQRSDGTQGFVNRSSGRRHRRRWRRPPSPPLQSTMWPYPLRISLHPTSMPPSTKVISNSWSNANVSAPYGSSRKERCHSKQLVPSTSGRWGRQMSSCPYHVYTRGQPKERLTDQRTVRQRNPSTGIYRFFLQASANILPTLPTHWLSNSRGI